MKCSKCHFDNPEGINFCGECGSKIDNLCSKGNFSNPLQFKFCGQCGHNLKIPTEPLSKYLSFDEKIKKIQIRFEALGKRQIKGREKAVNVYQLLAPSTKRTRFDVSAGGGLTPFVGRERENELLLDCYERVKAAKGQAFSITSGAGLGKSRLLAEIRKTVANENPKGDQ
ncbi:MAG: zinc ribbon domain-containing protein [Desulfobacterales bacterium]|jgi:hypothetical protein